jgi:hypothetical protein
VAKTVAVGCVSSERLWGPSPSARLGMTADGAVAYDSAVVIPRIRQWEPC